MFLFGVWTATADGRGREGAMRAKRTDRNHREIMRTLRQLGWSVIDLSGVGKGCPDLIARRGSDVRLVEVKTEKGRLTPAQVALADSGWTIRIVRTTDDCLKL